MPQTMRDKNARKKLMSMPDRMADNMKWQILQSWVTLISDLWDGVQLGNGLQLLIQTFGLDDWTPLLRGAKCGAEIFAGRSEYGCGSRLFS